MPVITEAEVRNFVAAKCPKATEGEIVLFVKLCVYRQLNPFLNEAYLIKFGTAPATQVVAKEVFLKRANARDTYQGFTAGITIKHKDSLERREGSLLLEGETMVGGWCKVFDSRYTNPMLAEVSLAEYDKNQAMWKSNKATMIRKVPADYIQSADNIGKGIVAGQSIITAAEVIITFFHITYSNFYGRLEMLLFCDRLKSTVVRYFLEK